MSSGRILSKGTKGSDPFAPFLLKMFGRLVENDYL